ncbi:MAG: hypothetical protein OEV28_14375, partial [Nitrospirota bacterium]|nr:hypothetical protein [Nitrospirota bacterium]
MFKKTIKIVLLSFAALAVVLGVVLLINAFDDELDPRIAAFAVDGKVAVKEADNAYYAAIMLHEDVKLDVPGIHAKGVKWVGAMNAAISSNALEEKSIAGALKGDGLVFKGDIGLIELAPVINAEEQTPGLIRLLRVKGELKAVIEANRALLDRYTALYKYPEYYVALKTTTNAPIVSLGVEQRLAHARIALMLDAGDRGAPLRLLTDDVLFWRRALKGSRGYFDRPVIVAAIWRDMVFLNEILNAYNFSSSELFIIEKSLRPLTEAELDNSSAAVDNFMVGRYAIETFARGDAGGMPAWKYYLLRPFFCRNATINTLYRYQAVLAEFAKFEPREQAEALRNRRIPRMYGPDDKAPVWTMFYNPVGKIVLGSGAQTAAYNRY